MKDLNEKQLITARSDFHTFLAVGETNFSKLKLSTKAAVFKNKFNTTFEELGCVGYNPAFKELTVTVKIKRATGYSGNLCSNGSYEYVRFYMDYNDGNGWQDMGYSAVNVHDIPTEKDCSGKNEKPIDYVVRLKINPKRYFCTKENLPKVKAVLSWNTIPAANDPNLTIGTYVWSDVKEEHIQIAPYKFLVPGIQDFTLAPFLEKAVLNPNSSLQQIAETEVDGIEKLQLATKQALPQKLGFAELAANYQDLKIEPHRFGAPLLEKAMSTNNLELQQSVINAFELQNLSYFDSLVAYQNMNCNTTYEELFCVGADYNQEALVGTLKIKRPSGYSGDLCKKGSKEYIAFYIQEENNCSWIHAGTTFVEVHDIDNMPDTGLSYSVILPYDFSQLKKRCHKPQVLKVRAVLSWNSPPTSMNCKTWGNVVESYIQLKPRKYSLTSPTMVIVGGIATDEINPATGLTVPGASFVLNGKSTYNNSPFGGVIAVQGNTASFAGQKYRVRLDNLSKGTSSYLTTPFDLVGFNPVTGDVTHSQSVPVGNEYTYPNYNDNIGSFMARFSPGTSDRIRITIEHLNGTFDSQVIQMSNTLPDATLSIDDNGDCTHYNQGDTINGTFTVDEAYMESYVLSTNVGTYQYVSGIPQIGIGDNGDPDGTGNFQIVTFTDKNCGSISVKVISKTIWNSASTGRYDNPHLTVCLK